MKKIIVILLTLLAGIGAKAQKTTPGNYTYIAQRYEWIAGVFQALGLPAGGNAAFTTGQVPRAGALYYDSTGGDAGIKVWTGLAWASIGGISQQTLDDSAAAIRADFPDEIDTASLSDRINLKIDSIGRRAGIDSFDVYKNGVYVYSVKDSTGGNLLVDSLGNAGTMVELIVPRNNILVHRLLNTGINYILTDTIPDGSIRIRLDTASATLKAYISANSGSTNNWGVSGNSGLSPSTNFIGNTDSVDLNFRTKNLNKLILTGNGKLLFDSAHLADVAHSVIFHVPVGSGLDGFLIQPKSSVSTAKQLNVNNASGASIFNVTNTTVNVTSSASNLSVLNIYNTGTARGRILLNSSSSGGANGLIHLSGDAGTSSVVVIRNMGNTVNKIVEYRNYLDAVVGSVSPAGVGAFSGGILGTSTNDAATAGNVGERAESVVSTYTNFTTTATYQNITSITLTAGDWDLSAFFTYSTNSATITAASDAIFLISTTTASAAGSTEGVNVAYVPQASLLGTSHFSDGITPYRVSIASPTTYYLNAQATFTLGNPQYVGSIRARRIR